MFVERDKYYTNLAVATEEVLAPLPPTPITAEARTRLNDWGMSDGQIDRLRSMASLFRYDRCPQKAERFADKTGYIYVNEDGDDAVVLPGFFDRIARLDGQCGDIASQLLYALHFSGFMTEIKTSLKANNRQPVYVCHAHGLSRTHFNREWMNHVWIGLVSLDTPPEEMAVIDASFQEISTLESNGYRLKKDTVVTNPLRGGVYPNGSTQITEYDRDKNKMLPDIRNEVLGTSYDRKFVYGIGFAWVTKSRVIRPYPYVTVTRAEEVEQSTCLLELNGDLTWCGSHDDVEGGHLREIRSILTSFEKLNLVRDQKMAESILSDNPLIQYKK